MERSRKQPLSYQPCLLDLSGLGCGFRLRSSQPFGGYRLSLMRSQTNDYLKRLLNMEEKKLGEKK
jgi:hypothetical protein